MYYVNMHHGDMGEASKGFHKIPPGSSCYAVLGVV